MREGLTCLVVNSLHPNPGYILCLHLNWMVLLIDFLKAISDIIVTVGGPRISHGLVPLLIAEQRQLFLVRCDSFSFYKGSGS